MPATAPFTAPEKLIGFFNVPLAAATRIYAGTMVALNAAGNAVPAADTAGLRVIGRAEQSVNNTSGAAGDLSIIVKPGVFQWLNKTTNSVVQATVGLPCYVSDDTVVCLAAGTANSIKAGVVISVDADGVYVDTGAAPSL